MIKRLEEKLEAAKEEFWNYSRRERMEEDDWTWYKLHELESNVEHLEFLLYCENYDRGLRV